MRKPWDYDAEPQALNDSNPASKSNWAILSFRPGPMLWGPKCWQAFCSPPSAMTIHHERTPSANTALRSFRGRPMLAEQLAKTLVANKRLIQARNQLRANRKRHDMGD
ncbi:hypothetical protein, partial [Blastomonas sp.]|uniref:hypothetical protein n=1 Tax=Blastomonas sp. TaxID=1909299 RepID=UPI00406A3808